MAISKIYTNQDIVNGLAAVCQGDNTVKYDPGVASQRDQHFASGDSLTLFQVQAGRYRFHGGPGGSGAWEH